MRIVILGILLFIVSYKIYPINADSTKLDFNTKNAILDYARMEYEDFFTLLWFYESHFKKSPQNIQGIIDFIDNNNLNYEKDKLYKCKIVFSDTAGILLSVHRLYKDPLKVTDSIFIAEIDYNLTIGKSIDPGSSIRSIIGVIDSAKIIMTANQVCIIKGFKTVLYTRVYIESAEKIRGEKSNTVSTKKNITQHLAQAMASYYSNDLQNAYEELAKAIEIDSNNIKALNYYAEVCRRLEQFEESRTSALRVLKLTKCNSFALSTLGNLYMPQYSDWDDIDYDSAWTYYKKAVECDDKEYEGWMGIYIESLRRDNKELEDKSLEMLYKIKFFSDQVLEYNRWMLRSLPQNSILLTNGDMDTYPALALQIVENLRPDVAIANYSLLNLYWYAEKVSKRYNISLPFTYEQAEKIEAKYSEDSTTVLYIGYYIAEYWTKCKEKGELSRPLAFAVTLNNFKFASDKRRKLIGPAYIYDPDYNEEFDPDAYEKAMTYLSPEKLKGKMISKMDRSPIRHNDNRHGFPENIISSYLKCAEYLNSNSMKDRARNMINWTLKLAEITEADKELKNEILKQKELIDQ